MKKNKKIDSIKKFDYQKQEDVLDFIDFLYGFFTSEFNLSSSIFPSGIKIEFNEPFNEPIRPISTT